MQRLSTIVLSIALTVFVIAASLALLAAAWLMAAQFLGGQSRWQLPTMSSTFYSMSVVPNPLVQKTGYWFRSCPY